MGITAGNVTIRMGIIRDEQDQFALAFQQKAAAAIASGRLQDEAIPLTVPQDRKKEPIIFDMDEFLRETFLEKLAKLKPALLGGGTVTAGNLSRHSDEASMLVLTSGQEATVLGPNPLVLVHSMSPTRTDPAYMGLRPVPATRKALK